MFKLEQIEADVVLVGVNEALGRVHVQCFWKCDIPKDELFKWAARNGHYWNEQDGGGMVTVEIHDFREPGMAQKLLDELGNHVMMQKIADIATEQY